LNTFKNKIIIQLRDSFVDSGKYVASIGKWYINFVSFIVKVRILLMIKATPLRKFYIICSFKFIEIDKENCPLPVKVIDFGLTSTKGFSSGSNPRTYAITEIVIGWLSLNGILHYFLPFPCEYESFNILFSSRYNYLMLNSSGTWAFCLRTTAIGE